MPRLATNTINYVLIDMPKYQSYNPSFPGPRSRFLHLLGDPVLSPLVGYDCYEILHFAYDLALWTDLGSKANKNLDIPLRLMLAGHSFMPEYWRSFHLAVVDWIRQRDIAQVFWTKSAWELSGPYHEWVRDEMSKQLNARMRSPVIETLHQTHVLQQVARGMVMGANCQKWKRNLCKAAKDCGLRGEAAYVNRIEFQDGKRKDPSQDYHGSGRPHGHLLASFHKLRDICIADVASASVPRDNEFLKGCVLGSQKDRDGETPHPIHTGPSEWDTEKQNWVLHHTASDHSRGIRGYFPDIMAADPSHQDLQISPDNLYHTYVTKYLPKFSDSMMSELLDSKADGDTIAFSVLQRYHPLEPEMALQLFGARFRQWDMSTANRGKRDFIVPRDLLPVALLCAQTYRDWAWINFDFARRAWDVNH